MAYPSYDPNAVNLALQNQGYSYRVPTQTQSADMTSGQPPQAAAPQTQPAPAQPAEVPGQQAKPIETDAGKVDGRGTLEGVQTAANGMASMSDNQKAQEGLGKLGALVGTVLSVYTGNAQGAKSGIEGMSNTGKQERGMA